MKKQTTLIIVLLLLLILTFSACRIVSKEKIVINEEPSVTEETEGTDSPSVTGGAETETAADATESTVPSFFPTKTEIPYETSTIVPLRYTEVPATDAETPKSTIMPTQNATRAQQTATATPQNKTATPKATIKTPAPTATIRPGIMQYDSCGKAIDFWFDSISADGVMLCADGKAGEYLTGLKNVIKTNAPGYNTLTLAGWVGFDEPITSFGYIIDGKTPVYGAFAEATESTIKLSTNGGEYAQRFSIDVPVSSLTLGEHTIETVVLLESGTVVLLDPAESPVSFTYSITNIVCPGLDITNKTDLVGICYTIWFNQIFGTNDTKPIKNVLNISEMIAQYGFNSTVGFGEGHNSVNSFHFWAEPAQGYYYSTDKTAAKNNLRLLGAAGVDYIIVDMTYASAKGNWNYPNTLWTNHLYKPSITLLDSILELRAAGETVPYIVFWVNNDSMFSSLKTQLLSVSKYASCFVYWNGNPFVLEWSYDGKTQYDGLTVRGMSGLSQSKLDYQWSYLEANNMNAASSTHIPVCVAAQSSYMSYTGANGRNKGRFWYNQWKNAFSLHPKMVTVTWWNEWAAQLLSTNVGYQFTDNYTEEYSRDIEPMKGGHGDQYYVWLCSYIKAYKEHRSCPKNYT